MAPSTFQKTASPPPKPVFKPEAKKAPTKEATQESKNAVQGLSGSRQTAKKDANMEKKATPIV